MDRQQHQDNSRRVVGELPQWNSRFRFSAQKKPPTSKDQQQPTPGGALRGQARRVPVAAAGEHAGPCHEPKGGAPKAGASSKATPQEPEKTPTLCLFERFERLTLGATPSTAAHTATSAAAAAAAATAAPDSAATNSSAGSEQCAARVRPGRHSVAFGTPSVLTYTPAHAGQGSEDAEHVDADEGTPLWSNAGHTPYSLAGSSTYSGSAMQLLPQQDSEDEDEEGSCDTYATGGMPLITAVGPTLQRVRPAGGRQGDVRVELFTSVIHEVPQDAAELTPAAALRCPTTPLEAAVPAGRDGAEEGWAAEEHGDSSTDALGAAAAGAEGGDACSDGYDSGSECDMQLQTPASCQLSFSARLQHAASASTAGKRGVAGRAPAPQAGSASKVAAAAAGSPSGFTGFAGGASAEQQAGSVTPTLFDGSRRGRSAAKAASSGLQGLMAGSSSTAPDAAAAAATPGSAGRSTRGAQARAELGSRSHTAAGRAAAAVETHVARLQGSRAAAAGTPPTAPRQRTLQFGTPATQRTPAAAYAAAAAAATPATAPRQRGTHLGAGAERTPAPAAAATDVPAAVGAGGEDDSFSSPAASMPPPAATPRSKLRQPERVAVETRMPVPTELSRLLGGVDAAAAPASSSSLLQHGSILGSCEVLSPVRARRQAKQTLGAVEQVLTPVRRSARKVKAAGGVLPDLQPMLEATNYCYTPNDALQR